MVTYAGSFVLMEETSEKSEKTEKAEEALHSIHHSKGFRRNISKNAFVPSGTRQEIRPELKEKALHYYLPANFNVHYIYCTSYLA